MNQEGSVLLQTCTKQIVWTVTVEIVRDEATDCQQLFHVDCHFSVSSFVVELKLFKNVCNFMSVVYYNALLLKLFVIINLLIIYLFTQLNCLIDKS